LDATVFFYRDKHGNEVDALLSIGRKLIPIEIKSSETYRGEFLKGLDYFRKIYNDRIQRSILVYGGSMEQKSGKTNIIHFRNLYKELDVK
jgi:hypothetical protein